MYHPDTFAAYANFQLRTDDLDMRLDTHGTPAENLQRLITDCGVSPHKVGGTDQSRTDVAGPGAGARTATESFCRPDNQLVLQSTQRGAISHR